MKNLGLARLVDRRAKESEQNFPDMTSRFPAVTDPIDQAALAKVLEDAHDDDTVRNEVANLLRRSNYPGLDDSLLRVLKNPEEKERFRAFAAQHLGDMAQMQNKKDTVVPELRKLLEDPHFAVRREALLALVRLKDEKGKETAVKWLKEDSPDASKSRDLTIRCVRELGLKEYLPEVRELGKSPDEATCIAALVTLSEWRDVESRPLFESAAQSRVVRLQRAGQAALKHLE